MPTFQTTSRFDRDWKQLTTDSRSRFERVISDHFVPDLAHGACRAALRVKGVQAAVGVFEMTWAPDGRATLSYRRQQRLGEPHVIWLRIGTREIFRNP